MTIRIVNTLGITCQFHLLHRALLLMRKLWLTRKFSVVPRFVCLKSERALQERKQSVTGLTRLFSQNQQNIPVMRLVMSKKQTRRKAQKVLKEGWMVHYTDKNNMRKKTYWRLDTKSIVMYLEENSSRYQKEIPLSDVLSIKSMISKDANGSLSLPSSHWFELKTANSTFYVGNILKKHKHKFKCFLIYNF